MTSKLDYLKRYTTTKNKASKPRDVKAITK